MGKRARTVLAVFVLAMVALVLTLPLPSSASALDFSGSGDTTVGPFYLPGGLTTFSWTYSSTAPDNFIVHLRNAGTGAIVDLLVNEIGRGGSGSVVVDPYGSAPLPAGDYELSLDAPGPWTASIAPVTAPPITNLAFSGSGIEAVGPFSLPGGDTKFDYTYSYATSDNFIVWMYSVDTGVAVDLLVNAWDIAGSGSVVVDPYGSAPLPAGSYMLDVYAPGGPWTMDLVPSGTLNRAPVAVDDTATVAQGGVLSVAAPGVLSNDTDADGDALTASLVTDVIYGTLTLNADGSYTYTPDAGLSGTDSFTYRAFDGTAYSAPARVTITVTAGMRTLTYTAGSNGTISGTSPQTVNYNGSGVAVTAVPNAGYHFVSWSDGVATAVRTDTNVTANRSVTANFAVNAIETRTLTYVAGTGGTISGTSLQTVAVGGSGTAVTAIPNSGYHFVNWSDASTQNPRTDGNVTSDKTVSAVFAANASDTLSLIYTAGPGGTISGTSPQSVARNGSGTAVTAVPSVGYRFVSWSDGYPGGAVRTDANVTANITASATFALKIKTSLTISSDRTTSTRGHSIVFSGKISPTSVASGTRITIWMRKSGHDWAKWGTAYTNGSDNWSFTVYNGTRAHGTYYIRVKYAGNSTYLSSYSPYKTVYIK